MGDFRQHVARAVGLVGGSQQKLAAALGCSQQQISYLLREADRISAEMALKIERATGGGVTAHDLRPDLYPSDGAHTSERVEPQQHEAAE